MDVRVEPAASDHVAAGGRDARAAEASEEGTCEEERGADLAAKLGVELGLLGVPRIRGTFDSVTGSLASRVAARIGRAPFLFPAAETRPPSGVPPSITKLSIRPLETRVADIGGLSY
jgi:hypothetical protein